MSSKQLSALQLHDGDVTSKTLGAAVRITHLLRLFRSYFCNSLLLFCRMFSPHPSPEGLILFCWHNLSICLRWKGRSGSHSHREGRFPDPRSSASSLQQQSVCRPRGRSPVSSQGMRAGGTCAPPYTSSIIHNNPSVLLWREHGDITHQHTGRELQLQSAP